MLHEYRELIAELRQTDNHFARLFDKHNALDEEVHRLESSPVVAGNQHELERLKKLKLEKLALKDEIYDYIKKIEAKRNADK